jgi:hypothetical protein
MRSFFGRAFTWLRDTVSGRRRLARYNHPDAHRRHGPDRDARLENYRASSNNIPFDGGGM